jgi:hypothetical protein
MSLLHLPRAFHPNSAGTPYALAKLYIYEEGTTDLVDVFNNRQLSTPLTNPVVADSNGVFPAIFVSPQNFPYLRMQLKDSADVLIYDQDNIQTAESVFASGLFTGSLIVAGTIQTSGEVNAGNIDIQAANPVIDFFENDRGTDLKLWQIDVNGGTFSIRTRTDANGVGKDVLSVIRGSTTSIATISIGNSTDALSVYLPSILASSSYADDAAAAAGGVPLGALYRTGSAIKIRMA